ADGAAAAGQPQTGRGQIALDGFEVPHMHAGNLDALAGGQVDFALAVLAGGVGDGFKMGRLQMAADDLDADGIQIAVFLRNDAGGFEGFDVPGDDGDERITAGGDV